MATYTRLLEDTLAGKKAKPFRRVLVEPVRYGRQLELHAYGIREQMPVYTVNRPQGLDAWLFMVFYDEAFFTRKGKRIPVPAGNLVAWGPGKAHLFGNDARPWCHSWVVCRGDWVQRRISENRIPLQQPLSLYDASFFDKGLLDIHTECADNPLPDPEIIRNLLHTLIRQAARAVRPGTFRVSERILPVKAHLDGHYEETQSLSDLSKRLTMSIPLLCREFKACLGVGVMTYVLRLRMEHARYLLSDTHLNVGEVGAKVGYPDIYLFSRMFKKRFGLSPKHYRRH